MIDYLRWRGDLTFEDHPFNEVDNLVLSILSYLNFGEIITEHAQISIRDAAKQYHNIGREQTDQFTAAITELLEKLAQTKRFSSSTLSRYIDILDDE